MKKIKISLQTIITPMVEEIISRLLERGEEETISRFEDEVYSRDTLKEVISCIEKYIIVD